MAPNMAQKRAAKANRRKAVLAERRRAEASESSLAGRVRRQARFDQHRVYDRQGGGGEGDPGQLSRRQGPAQHMLAERPGP